MLSATAVQASEIGLLTGSQEKWDKENEIRVAVTIDNNPGIIAMRLFVRYDEKILKLVSVDNGSIFKEADAEHGHVISDIPYILTWEEALSAKDNRKTGELVHLQFKIQPDAVFNETDILLQLDTGSTFNIDIEEVAFSVDSIHCSLPIKEPQKIALCKHENAKWESSQEATCRLTGIEQEVCPDCGKILNSRTTTAAGHQFDEWHIESPATDGHDGTEFRVCSVCQFRETKSFSNVTYTSPHVVSSPDSQSRNVTEEDQTDISFLTEGTSNPEKNTESVIQSHHISWLIIVIIITLVCLGGGVLIYMIVRKKEKHR